MKTIKGLCLGAALLAVAFVASDARAHDDDDAVAAIEGTGTFTSVVTRTTQTLTPPCVSLITRIGTVSFSGFISNVLANGTQVAHALRDACAAPVQGPTKQTYKLRNATVAGRTGDLVIESEGFFEGDAATAPGARNRYHFEIRGISGGLKHLRGEGQSVGLATGFPGVPATSSNTYYARAWFEDD